MRDSGHHHSTPSIERISAATGAPSHLESEHRQPINEQLEPRSCKTQVLLSPRALRIAGTGDFELRPLANMEMTN